MHSLVNALQNTKVIQAALTGQTGLVGFCAGSSRETGQVSELDTFYLVAGVTADDFLARFPEARPDLLKIDVEGAEYALLSGAQRLLAQHGPDILLALHGKEQSRACLQILTAHGYRLFYLDGSPITEGLPKQDELYARKGGDDTLGAR